MFKYIAKLKDGIKYDDDLKNFFKTHNIKVDKQLNQIDLLIINSPEAIDQKDFECFEVLEKDRNDFSI